jgi:hypothetical protein
MKLYIPEDSVRRLGALTLAASVNGEALEEALLETAGLFNYVRELKAAGELEIRFRLDKALPPDADDDRERGIIVAAIAVE